jgi:hypothetical protein
VERAPRACQCDSLVSKCYVFPPAARAELTLRERAELASVTCFVSKRYAISVLRAELTLRERAELCEGCSLVSKRYVISALRRGLTLRERAELCEGCSLVSKCYVISCATRLANLRARAELARVYLPCQRGLCETDSDRSCFGAGPRAPHSVRMFALRAE